MKQCIYCIFLAFASCSIYQSSFDCPAHKGVGCKSIHEVLDLIVERQGEEDVFIADEEAALQLKAKEKEKRKISGKEKLFLLKERSGNLVLVEEKD